jgi:hypothetical protein
LVPLVIGAPPELVVPGATVAPAPACMALNSLCDRRPSLSLSSSVKRLDQVASFA